MEKSDFFQSVVEHYENEALFRNVKHKEVLIKFKDDILKLRNELKIDMKTICEVLHRDHNVDISPHQLAALVSKINRANCTATKKRRKHTKKTIEQVVES